MKHKTKRALLLAKKYGSIVLCIAIDFFFGVGIYHSVTWISDKCHKEEPQVVDEYLTEYLRTIEKNDVVEIYNEKSEMVGSYRYVFAQNYGTSLTEQFMRSQVGAVMVVNDEDLFGFIHPVTGEVLVEPQYLLAWDCDPVSGLAACVNSEHKMGFVNVETNEISIPFTIDMDSAYFEPDVDHSYFDFIFNDGYSLVPGKDGLVGIMNISGEMVLPAEYSDIKTYGHGSQKKVWMEMPKEQFILNSQVIHNHEDHDNYYLCDPVIVERTDSTGVRYGVFDVHKGWIIPIMYEHMDYAFVEFDDILFLCQNDGVIQVRNDSGELVCNRSYYDDIHTHCDIHAILDNEGKVTNYIMYNTLNGWAVMDADFRVVIKPDDYCEISYLGNGIFACEKHDYSVVLKDEKIE